MSEEQSSRRNFLKVAGLTAGAALINGNTIAGVVDEKEILKLDPAQQEFMLAYGHWMDEFIEVIRARKIDPADLEANRKMKLLTDQAGEWKPQLTEYMKDEKFSIIYHASIERMKAEI